MTTAGTIGFREGHGSRTEPSRLASLAGELVPIGLRPQLVASFDPPRAAERFAAWRERNADALASLPPDAYRVEYGRTGAGLFVRVRIAEERVPPSLAPA
jgi:hypothetical protein